MSHKNMTNDVDVMLLLPPHLKFFNVTEGFFPLGLGYIATVLDQNKYKTIIYHTDICVSNDLRNYDPAIDNHNLYMHYFNISDDHSFVKSDKHNYVWDEIKATIEKYTPKIIGISVTTATVESMLRVARICKNQNQEIKIVLGGIHPTSSPDDMIKNPNIDFIVRGEGEVTMLELVTSLLRNGKPLSEIEGITYKDKGKIIHNPSRKLIQDLDNLPFPKRNLVLGYDNLSIKYKKDIFVGTSRGCPYTCSFCSCSAAWGRHVRYRSIENIIREIEFLKNEYKAKFIIFYDDNMTLNRKRFKQFCENIIGKKINIHWACLSRADHLDEDLLLLMKKAGCLAIGMGVESGSNRMLSFMNKNEQVSDFLKASELVRKYNIWLTAYFMFGLPSETREDLQNTKELMEKMQPNEIYLYRYYPVPNTGFYSYLIEKGYYNSNNMKYESVANFIAPPSHEFVDSIPREDFYNIAKDLFNFVISHNIEQRRLTKNYKFFSRVLFEKIRYSLF